MLTLRGEGGNCLSKALARELRAGLEEAAALPGVRALVLEGGENFCVGADLKERAVLPQERWVVNSWPEIRLFLSGAALLE